MRLTTPGTGIGLVGLVLSLLRISVVTGQSNTGTDGLVRGCDEVADFPLIFAPDFQLRYLADVTDPSTGSGTATFELIRNSGTGWLGLGFTETSWYSTGGVTSGSDQMVIGNSADGVQQWSMFPRGSTSMSGQAVLPQQTITDASFTQNATHTVLRFTKPLTEANTVSVSADGVTRNLLVWAYGAGDAVGAIGDAGGRHIPFEPCVPPPPTAAPSLPAAVDCTQFQSTVDLFNNELVMDYVVTTDGNGTGILKASLTYSGKAWISFGISPLGSLSMIPADAIAGVPGLDVAHNPGKYQMDAKAIKGVRLYPDEQQTLINATLYQDEAMTQMNFTKILVEEGELPLNGTGENTIQWAIGANNNFNFHIRRGIKTLPLRPCTEDDAGTTDDIVIEEIELPDRQKGLWIAHGIFATIAWVGLIPAGIACSMLRNRLPPGRWMKLHLQLNFAGLVLTLLSFFLGVAAQARMTPPGQDPNHFSGVAHTSVGLVITIFCFLQVVNGLYRAPNAKPKEDGTMPKKPLLRVVWEYGHKGFGVVLLAVSWWQVQDGLGLYAFLFDSADPTRLFVLVALFASILVIGTYVYDNYFSGDAEAEPTPPAPSAGEQVSEEPKTEEAPKEASDEK